MEQSTFSEHFGSPADTDLSAPNRQATVILPETGRPTIPWTRLAKLGLGMVLLAVGGIATYQHLIVEVARDSVINARLQVIRAPIDGVVTTAVGVPGNQVRAGGVIAQIQDPHPDDARLFALGQQAAATEREEENAARRLSDLRQARTLAEAQADAYRAGRIREDEARVAAARANLAVAIARETAAAAAASRSAVLAAHGFEAKATRDRLEYTEDAARAEVVAARKTLDALTIDLNAAKSGTYLGDNYNDVPSSFQRARELTLSIAEARAALSQLAEKKKALDTAITTERARLAARSRVLLTAPVSGRLWSAQTASGEYVRKGERLFTMLDCSSSLVMASVSDSQYNRLRIGEPVRFRMAGTGDEYPGRIVKLGPIPDAIDLAIPPDMRGRQILVASRELSGDHENGCAVGRTGRIIFDGHHHSMATRLARWVRNVLFAS